MQLHILPTYEGTLLFAWAPQITRLRAQLIHTQGDRHNDVMPSEPSVRGSHCIRFRVWTLMLRNSKLIIDTRVQGRVRDN
jgi:hypothetical protein